MSQDNTNPKRRRWMSKAGSPRADDHRTAVRRVDHGDGRRVAAGDDRSVQFANEYSQGYGTATQHARVAHRPDRPAVQQAYGKSIYPGVWVTQDTDGQWTYPNTLIVWQPSGTPANPSGPPLVQELVIFCPDPNAPNDLVQLTVPGNTTTVPTTNTPSFTSLINSLKTSSTANKVVLTNLLQVASVSGPAAERQRARRCDSS